METTRHDPRDSTCIFWGGDPRELNAGAHCHQCWTAADERGGGVTLTAALAVIALALAVAVCVAAVWMVRR